MGDSADWCDENLRVICELFAEEVKAKNRSGTHLNRLGYSNAISHFKERTGLSYTRLHMKNKWDKLRADYGQWKILQNETGSGWDPVKKTFSAPDWWWTKINEQYNGCAKFKDQPLKYEEELGIMFEDLWNTGEDHRAPSSGDPPEPSEGQQEQDKDKEEDRDVDDADYADPKLRIVERPVEEEPADPKLRIVECPVEVESADPKLRILEHSVEEEEQQEEHKKCGVGEEEEEENSDGGDSVEEDSNDSVENFDEDGNPCLPYCVYLDLAPVCAAGPNYTLEEARQICAEVGEKNLELLGEWLHMDKNNRTHLPLMPLDVLPKVTTTCVYGNACYHRSYWTEMTSETAPTHPYFRPCGMLQVFSLRLSSPLNHPVSIYGTFSIRDCWEPLHNYIFKHSRDDPAMVPQGSFLPLRSPCRGIYVLQYILFDIDLWIKEDGSADKQLFCGYVEMDTSSSAFGLKLEGRLQGDYHGLDMHFAFLWDSIETVVEVLAEAEHPLDLKISALTTGFDDEVSLYDGTFCGRGAIFRHFLAVKKQEELSVVLKMDDSLYKWTFKAGAGVLISPEHPVSGFTQYFVMNVSFRTRGKAASAWQWSCICNDVRVSETCL